MQKNNKKENKKKTTFKQQTFKDFGFNREETKVELQDLSSKGQNKAKEFTLEQFLGEKYNPKLEEESSTFEKKTEENFKEFDKLTKEDFHLNEGLFSKKLDDAFKGFNEATKNSTIFKDKEGIINEIKYAYDGIQDLKGDQFNEKEKSKLFNDYINKVYQTQLMSVVKDLQKAPLEEKMNATQIFTAYDELKNNINDALKEEGMLPENAKIDSITNNKEQIKDCVNEAYLEFITPENKEEITNQLSEFDKMIDEWAAPDPNSIGRDSNRMSAAPQENSQDDFNNQENNYPPEEEKKEEEKEIKKPEENEQDQNNYPDKEEIETVEEIELTEEDKKKGIVRIEETTKVIDDGKKKEEVKEDQVDDTQKTIDKENQEDSKEKQEEVEKPKEEANKQKAEESENVKEEEKESKEIKEQESSKDKIEEIKEKQEEVEKPKEEANEQKAEEFEKAKEEKESEEIQKEASKPVQEEVKDKDKEKDKEAKEVKEPNQEQVNKLVQEEVKDKDKEKDKEVPVDYSKEAEKELKQEKVEEIKVQQDAKEVPVNAKEEPVKEVKKEEVKEEKKEEPKEIKFSPEFEDALKGFNEATGNNIAIEDFKKELLGIQEKAKGKEEPLASQIKNDAYSNLYKDTLETAHQWNNHLRYEKKSHINPSQINAMFDNLMDDFDAEAKANGIISEDYHRNSPETVSAKDKFDISSKYCKNQKEKNAIKSAYNTNKANEKKACDEELHKATLSINKATGSQFSSKDIMNLFENAFKASKANSLEGMQEDCAKKYDSFLHEAFKKMVEKTKLGEEDTIAERVKGFDAFTKKVENSLKNRGFLPQDKKHELNGGLPETFVKETQMNHIKDLPKTTMEKASKEIKDLSGKPLYDVISKVCHAIPENSATAMKSVETNEAISYLRALQDKHLTKSFGQKFLHPFKHREEQKLIDAGIELFNQRGYNKDDISNLVQNPLSKEEDPVAKQLEKEVESVNKEDDKNKEIKNELEDANKQAQINGERKPIEVPESNTLKELNEVDKTNKKIEKNKELKKEDVSVGKGKN